MDSARTLPPNNTLPATGPAAPAPISRGVRARSRRRWGVFTGCLLLAVLGALVAASLTARAGDRHDVLAVARDVPVGEVIDPGDVVVASIADDPALSPVPAAQRGTVVGQRAAVDLRRGTLLTADAVRAGGALGDDAQLIGVELTRGQAPRGALAPGDEVLAVLLPTAAAGQGDAEGKEALPDSIEARVVTVGTPDAQGVLTVNLAVDPADGPRLAMRAATKQIALIRQPRS